MSWTTFLTEGIGLITGGITGVASGIGTGLSSLVSALAVDSTGTTPVMSPFMAVVFVFGGIALALALSRWVVNLLSSLGQRNR